MRLNVETTRVFALTLALGLGTATFAMGQAEAVDTDGDGMVSYAELLTLMPALTEEEYSALDADADGLLSADEITAGQDAGLIPAS